MDFREYCWKRKNELKHHGILGQKWGKQNGPPYPLDADDHSKSEERDGWRKSLGGKRNDKIYERHRRDLRKKEKKLTDEQKAKIKKYIKIGAAVAGTALVAYGAYKLYENKDYLAMKAKMGRKNVDFIQNSGKFDYLDKAFESDALDSVEEVKSKFKNESSLANSIVDRMEHADEAFKGFTTTDDIRNLTDDELRALQAYTTPRFYKQVNGVAEGLANNYDPGYFGGYDESSKMIAKDIMSAMDKTTLKKDAQLQRGISESACRHILGNELFDSLEAARYRCNKDPNYNGEIMKLDSLKFATVPSKGFTSTGIPMELPMVKKDRSGFVLNDDGSKKMKLHSIADYFSGQEGIIFDVKAKAGMHAIDLSSISELKAEREILFGVNSDIIPNGEFAIIDGIIHVYGDLVQR